MRYLLYSLCLTMCLCATSPHFLTQRWLQHVAVLFTGADRLDIRRVDQPPEVIAVVASVQAETQADPS